MLPTGLGGQPSNALIGTQGRVEGMESAMAPSRAARWVGTFAGGIVAVTSLTVTGALPAASALAPAAPAPALVSEVPDTGLPVVSVTLEDPYTLDDVHADKDLEVPATVSVDDPTDQFDVTDAVAEFEGRGNFTWTLDKKPYQIKFDSKTSVLGMGVAKKWVLLANHADASLMRNKIAYDLADQVGLPFSPKSQFVDVEVDGEYLGNYLLSEKTEVGTNRVELADDQGVLLELDNNYGTAEPWYFRSTTSDTIFVLKDAVSDFEDDLLEGDALAGYEDAKAAVNKLDALLAAPNPDWAAISAVIDVDSLARYYIVQEFTANSDIGQSSIYFYKDGPGDKLHIGPVWDYDVALGNFDLMPRGGNSTENYTKNVTWIRGTGNDWYRQLFRNPEFVELVDNVYETIRRPRGRRPGHRHRHPGGRHRRLRRRQLRTSGPSSASPCCCPSRTATTRTRGRARSTGSRAGRPPGGTSSRVRTSRGCRCCRTGRKCSPSVGSRG